MERQIYSELKRWKDSEPRKPLLLQGVRQCGKTWILKKFGAQEFENVAYFNFERNGILSTVFDRDLDPRRIVRELSALGDVPIRPSTLVILDEIQCCRRAISSLKYFCEEAPEYHIACAGSLLGVVLAEDERRSRRKEQSDEKASFPVGKVDTITMHPMSFREFLYAEGKNGLADLADDGDITEPLSEAILSTLEGHYLEYLCVGGMPEAVQSWIDKSDMAEVEHIHETIMNSYARDFGKHARPSMIPRLNAVWDSIPMQLAKDTKRFIFGRAFPGARGSDLDDAVQWLSDAGMIHKVVSISKAELPLDAFAEPMVYKLYYCDVGLLRTKARMPASAILLREKSFGLFDGALTENFVLNELIAAGEEKEWYWTSSANAEVDFILQPDTRIVPIEVKAGERVRAASLKVFMDRYRTGTAVLVSMKNRGRNGPVVHVPLPLSWTIPSVVRGSAEVPPEDGDAPSRGR